MAGRLQNEDSKSLAEITGAGGAASQLLNDTKIYVTGASLNKQLSQAIQDGDIGGGGGFPNYLTGNDTAFKSSVGNWVTFNEGGASPIDLSGGTANYVSIARGTTFDSTGNLAVTKTANNAQGEGLSITTAIPVKGQSCAHDVEFRYKTSGYLDNEAEVWVYLINTGTSRLVQLSNYQLKASLSSGVFKAQFQTDYDTTSIRLGIFWKATTTTAATILIDDVRVGTSVYNYGMSGTDWKSFVPTGSWVTNTSYSGYGKMIGDEWHFDITILLSGAPNATVLGINIPSSIGIIDSSKCDINNSIFAKNQAFFDSSTPAWYGNTDCAGNGTTTSMVVRAMRINAADNHDYANVSNTFPITWTNGDRITIRGCVPILGKSTSVQMSDSADQRAVYLNVRGSSSQPIANTGAQVVRTFDSVASDTHAAYNAANGRWTCPVSGYYQMQAVMMYISAGWAIGNWYQIIFRVNGTGVSWAENDFYQATGVNIYAGLNHIYSQWLNAGDYVECAYAHTRTAGALNSYGNAGYEQFQIFKIQAPTTIGATETVACNAYLSSNQTGVNPNASFVKININAVEKDTHGAFSTSLYRWTAPVAGWYQINANLFIEATNTVADVYTACIYKNGSLLIYGKSSTVVTASYNSHSVSTVKYLVAGDYLELYMYGQGNNSVNTLTARGTSPGTTTYFQIIRVGI